MPFDGRKKCVCVRVYVLRARGLNNFLLVLKFRLDRFWPILHRFCRHRLRRFTSCVCVLRVRGT